MSLSHRRHELIDVFSAGDDRAYTFYMTEITKAAKSPKFPNCWTDDLAPPIPLPICPTIRGSETGSISVILNTETDAVSGLASHSQNRE
jgi:hypothetical protein